METLTLINQKTRNDNYRKYSPLKAIRKKCLWCCEGQFNEVSLCASESCPFHPWRAGRKPADVDMSALKVIRHKCLQDCGTEGAFSEVRDCELKDCPLWPYRLGKRPTDDVWRAFFTAA